MGQASNTQGRVYVFGIGLWVLACIFALKYGAVPGAEFDLVIQLRLPRVLIATAVGAGLAVAGAVLQVLFSNPLCEPYTLGVSSGSALGAVLGVALGLEWSFAGLAGTAFAGALVFASVLYAISLRPGVSNVTLLLAGVVLGFLGSSLVALQMALFDPNGLQGAMLWIMGDLSRARIQGASSALLGVMALIGALWLKWRDLDALLMGEEGARALGVDTSRIRRKVILLVSLLIGLCVSGSGMIGFIGLIVPHFIRRFSGSLYRSLIPLCAIFGAATLVFADALARIVARPYELPVGVVTALFGAPMFLWVILHRKEVRD